MIGVRLMLAARGMAMLTSGWYGEWPALLAWNLAIAAVCQLAARVGPR